MLSLYIHVPFCVRKCRYCGFYSTPSSDGNADAFLSGLKCEAASYQDYFEHKRVSSIYVGGGTPTVLASEQFSMLAEIVREHLSIDAGVEFTVEANPNTVTHEKLHCIRSQGANRLSLGIQSFSDEILRILGRLHTAEQAADAFKLARNTGFDNISVDLIYGIPGQTRDHWEETLNAACSLKPEHISAYSLSLDSGSQFMREAEAGEFALPDDELCAGMFERAVSVLTNSGYGQYEISNFSKPGYECRHNMNYWERGEYLGLGPGAWSFISGRRYANIADIQEYVKRLASGRPIIDEQERADAASSARETLLLSLRTGKGLDLSGFGKMFGPEYLDRLETNMLPLMETGLLRLADGRLRLTDRGILVSDAVLTRLSV
jgi:oxygen-independent coproporphyrinogen-3 oxidase